MNDNLKGLCPYCLAPLSDKGACTECGKKYRAADFPARRLPPLHVLKNRYMVGRTLGEGGFGITYFGADRLGGAVAIKEYCPDRLAERRGAALEPSVQTRAAFMRGKARFMTEAKCMAAVKNVEGIAAVLDFFSENNTAYIVMEYIGGETLSEYLAKKGRLSFREAFTVLRPVLEALGRLHEAGVVHGDVSPDNIILTDGGARLIDFGAAARSGVFEGTRKVTLKKRYAPPEQYNSGTVPGPRTDVYAAGVTLYYCVTAALPPESTARETRDLVRRPSALGARISADEEAALMKAIEPAPDRRYPNMRAMIAALASAVAV